MKIVIAGAGEVGTYLAKMLYTGNHDIVIVDTDADKLRSIDAHFDLLTVNGSATSITVLKKANVGNADLFIAITEIEEVNMMAAILAKKLGAQKTIARIDNKEYLQPDQQEFFKNMGVDSLIYPEILASGELVNLLEHAGTTKTFEFAGGKLSLYVLKLEADTKIIGKTLIQAAIDNEPHEYRTVAITRNSKTIIPHGADRFKEGDLVYIVSNEEGIRQLMDYSGKLDFEIKNLMILGGSRIGKKTAKVLEGRMNIKLLELDKEKSFELADTLEKTLVVNGDGRDIELLIDEGLPEMDAFIAVTGNSETNILSCLVARKMGVKKTIAEIENMDYIDLAENMGIDTIINKKRVAASHIFSFTMSVDVATVQCLTATDAEIMEFNVKANSRITKKILRDLNFPDSAVIGGVVRGDTSFIAKGDTRFQENDKVIIFALPQAIDKVAKLF